MLDAIGQIVGGIGLLVFGMWLLSENLKSMAGSRLRNLSRNLTGNRFLAFGWGLIVGGVTQSTTATMSIVVGLRKSGLVSSRRGLLLVSGSPLGASLFLLLLTIDIRFVSLCILGMTALVVTSDRAIRYQPLATAVLAIGFILFGFSLMTEAAGLLSKLDWFQEILDMSIQSLPFGFLISAIASFAIHSSIPVIALGIGMVLAGAIEIDHYFVLVCGSTVGQAFSLFLVSWNLRGTARHIVVFSFSLLIFSSIFWIALYLLEKYFGIPTIAAVFNMTEIGLAFRLVLITILFCLPLQIIVLFFPRFFANILSRFWPVDEIERISRPKFVGDHLLVDTESSLDLVRLEQNRVLEMFSDYLELVRQGKDFRQISDAVRELNAQITDFLTELGRLHPGQSIERRGEATSRQMLIGWLEEQISDLCAALEALPAGTGEPDRSPADPAQRPLEDFRNNLVEGVDGALLAILHALDHEDEASLSDARKLTDDRGTLMRKLRNIYTQPEHDRSEEEERSIVDATIAVQNLFFLMAQLVARATGPDLASTAPRPAG